MSHIGQSDLKISVGRMFGSGTCSGHAEEANCTWLHRPWNMNSVLQQIFQFSIATAMLGAVTSVIHF